MKSHFTTGETGSGISSNCKTHTTRSHCQPGTFFQSGLRKRWVLNLALMKKSLGANRRKNIPGMGPTYVKALRHEWVLVFRGLLQPNLAVMENTHIIMGLANFLQF